MHSFFFCKKNYETKIFSKEKNSNFISPVILYFNITFHFSK